MDHRALFRRRALGTYLIEDAVAWAQNLADHHAGRPLLAKLAALQVPLNPFEVEKLVRGSLVELGVEEPPHEETYRQFLIETARAVLAGDMAPREACDLFKDLHGGDLGHLELQPFYQLALGLEDLGATGQARHYPGLTVDTFDDLVREESRKLLKALGAEHAATPPADGR